MPPDEEEGMLVLFQCFLSLPDLEIQCLSRQCVCCGSTYQFRIKLDSRYADKQWLSKKYSVKPNGEYTDEVFLHSLFKCEHEVWLKERIFKMPL